MTSSRRREPVVTGESRSSATGSLTGFERHAAIGLWAAAIPLMVGNFVDLFTLWVLQRQSGPTWEFVAVANTIDAFPRLALAFGLLFPAAYLQRWNSLAFYRVLSTILILLGLGALALGLAEMTNYFALRGAGSPESRALLYSTTMKALGLSGLFFLLLTPLGILGWRRPRR